MSSVQPTPASDHVVLLVLEGQVAKLQDELETQGELLSNLLERVIDLEQGATGNGMSVEYEEYEF